MPECNVNRNSRKFKIIAAGPIVIEDGAVPSRVVLRRHGDGGFVTHKQGLAGARHHLHRAFATGVYFLFSETTPRKTWQRALENFTIRVLGHTLAIHPDQIKDI